MSDDMIIVGGDKIREMCAKQKRPHNEFKYYKNHEFSRNPKKAHPLDSGYDICSCEHVTIEPKQWEVVNTGLQFDIPDGWEIQIRSRSGLAAKKGIMVLNGIGTVDCEYTGEIKVILMNMGEYPFHILPGERIAQLVMMPIYPTIITEIFEEPTNETRGDKGFGSTGV